MLSSDLLFIPEDDYTVFHCCSDLWSCRWMVIVPSLCTITRRLCRAGAKSPCAAGNLGHGCQCWVTVGRMTVQSGCHAGCTPGRDLGSLSLWFFSKLVEAFLNHHKLEVCCLLWYKTNSQCGLIFLSFCLRKGAAYLGK